MWKDKLKSLCLWSSRRLPEETGTDRWSYQCDRSSKQLWSCVITQSSWGVGTWQGGNFTSDTNKHPPVSRSHAGRQSERHTWTPDTNQPWQQEGEKATRQNLLLVSSRQLWRSSVKTRVSLTAPWVSPDEATATPAWHRRDQNKVVGRDGDTEEDSCSSTSPLSLFPSNQQMLPSSSLTRSDDMDGHRKSVWTCISSFSVRSTSTCLSQAGASEPWSLLWSGSLHKEIIWRLIKW